MYVITVQFTIDQEHWGRFLPLMYENARRSREKEPGCRQFDVCVDPQREGLVFLYELYVDRAAFDGHLASSHYQEFVTKTKGMILHRDVHPWERVAP
jgi:(4S)-4-hydroxy-5-phosphonooxypentane-2,3-dione isomerase